MAWCSPERRGGQDASRRGGPARRRCPGRRRGSSATRPPSRSRWARWPTSCRPTSARRWAPARTTGPRCSTALAATWPTGRTGIGCCCSSTTSTTSTPRRSPCCSRSPSSGRSSWWPPCAPGHRCPAVIRSLLKEGHLTIETIPVLSVDEVATLLHRVLDGPIDTDAVSQLAEVSGGNLQVLRELVLRAQEQGTLVLERGRWRLRGLPRSAGLDELIGAHLGELAGAELDGLEALAVAGTLGLADLEALVGPDVAASLDRRGLLRVTTDQRRTRVGVAHPIYGEILRQQMTVLRTRQLQRDLADRLEAHGARRRDDLTQLALWRLEAGGEVEADVLVNAGRLAVLGRDPDQARRFAQAAGDAGRGHDAALLALGGRGARQRRRGDRAGRGRRLVGPLAAPRRSRSQVARRLANARFWQGDLDGALRAPRRCRAPAHRGGAGGDGPRPARPAPGQQRSAEGGARDRGGRRARGRPSGAGRPGRGPERGLPQPGPVLRGDRGGPGRCSNPVRAAGLAAPPWHGVARAQRGARPHLRRALRGGQGDDRGRHPRRAAGAGAGRHGVVRGGAGRDRAGLRPGRRGGPPLLERCGPGHRCRAGRRAGLGPRGDRPGPPAARREPGRERGSGPGRRPHQPGGHLLGHARAGPSLAPGRSRRPGRRPPVDRRGGRGGAPGRHVELRVRRGARPGPLRRPGGRRRTARRAGAARRRPLRPGAGRPRQGGGGGRRVGARGRGGPVRPAPVLRPGGRDGDGAGRAAPPRRVGAPRRRRHTAGGRAGRGGRRRGDPGTAARRRRRALVGPGAGGGAAGRRGDGQQADRRSGSSCPSGRSIPTSAAPTASSGSPDGRSCGTPSIPPREPWAPRPPGTPRPTDPAHQRGRRRRTTPRGRCLRTRTPTIGIRYRCRRGPVVPRWGHRDRSDTRCEP